METQSTFLDKVRIALRNITSNKSIEISLVAAFVLAGAAIAFSNPYSVQQWFLSDDAFYYFKVAQNITEGRGSTLDGVNPTNGYHPLWMLVCIPVFALARQDLILPLRVIILISSGLGAGSAVLLFRMLRRVVEKEIAIGIVVLWAFTWTFFKQTTTGGMETILSAFFILLLWERTVHLNQQESITIRQIGQVGLIAIFTFLSRLDNIFLVFFAGVWIWLRWWRPIPQGTSDSRGSWRWRLQTGIAYYLPVTLVLLAYMGINQSAYGSALPVSSQVKVWWGTLGLTIYGGPLYIYPEYIFEYLLPVRRGAGPWELVTAPIHHTAERLWDSFGRDFTLEPLAITYGVIGLVLAAIAAPGRKRLFRISGQLGLLLFFAATMAQSIYYFWRDAYHLRTWYWVSQNMFLFLLLAVFISVIFGYLRKVRFSREFLTLVVTGVVLFTMVTFARHVARRTYHGVEDVPHYYQQKSQSIRDLTAPDDVLAAIGSGSFSYFLPEYQVVNLDGLINSQEYFEHLKAGSAIDFLAEMNVDYIIGKEYLVTEAKPYGGNFGPYLTPYAEFQIENEEWHIYRVDPQLQGTNGE